MNKRKDQPPEWALRFFLWFCSEEQREILQGDLYELFEYRSARQGSRKAKWLFVFDVFDLLRPFAISRKSQDQNNVPMINNYLKIAYRNFLRQKAYSLINVMGLSLGITCSLLIYLYIQDELSFDRMHSKADRIYRIPERFQAEGVGEHSASNPFALGPTIIEEYPHLIAHMTRMFNFQAPSLSLKNEESDTEFNESRLFLVDSTFFNVFDFEWVVGHKKTALDGPNHILLTETMSRKYFGEQDPLGKTLLFQGDKRLVVSGILKDAPLNAHFQFDGLISFSTIRSMISAPQLKAFFWNPCWTYLALKDNSLKEELEQQLPLYVHKYFSENKRDHVTLSLQPLTDIHLTSRLDYEIQANGNENNIVIFSTVALFVLMIAGINFVNLSTARATKRAKEVGIRKTLGSKKLQLVTQFIFEAVLYAFLSTIIALLVVLLLLPVFNGFTGKDISLNMLFEANTILSLLGLMLVIGLLSGVYPSFILSRFDPVRVLKGASLKVGGLTFRRALVILQFMVSILLIIGARVAVQQLELLQDDNLGFDRESVLMVPVARTPIGSHYETMRQELLRQGEIHSVTAVEEIIGAKNQVGIYQFEGMTAPTPFPRLMVRHDFLKTFGMELVAGRDYSEDIQSDVQWSLLVNESFVKSMGWGDNESAVGKTFKKRQGEGKIIGVVKDFNYASKHLPIAPLIMDLMVSPSSFNLFIKYMAVRVSGSNVPETLGSMRTVWKTFIPDRPFEYFFLDSRLARSYESEDKLSRLTFLFSALSIFVACMGLFGLATFTAEQRAKEIGIRKVLGISPPQIMVLLSKDFMLLILIAFIITTPVALYFLEQWLSQFAYRVSVDSGPFVVAGLTIFLVAFLTVSYHGLRAIRINPVSILKDE